MNTNFVEASIAAGKVSPLINRHPWIYADSINFKGGIPKAGETVRVTAPDGRFLGWGLCSPPSVIRVRMYSFRENEPPSAELFRSRLLAAVNYREFLVGTGTDSYRLVFGEGDGLPGLIIDRYAGFLAVTFTTSAMAAHAELLLELVTEIMQPEGIVCIPDEHMAELEGFVHPTGVVHGSVPQVISATENGVKYSLALDSSQRKMLYFDQRENRKAVASYAKGSLLDLYCYTGGFSLNALLNGSVESAYCVDSSAPALTALEANVTENGISKKVEIEKNDAIGAAVNLRRQDRRFDTIVVDPPRIVADRRSYEGGMKKYSQINETALGLVNNGGLFVTCSCSGLVHQRDFLRAVSIASARAGRELALIEMRGQAPDHPVMPNFVEGAYLKCAIFRVRD